MRKTYSQIIAGFFLLGYGSLAIFDILSLIYFVPLVLIIGIYAIAGIAAGQGATVGVILFLALIFRVAWIVFDVRLSIAFFRHTRGTLKVEKIDRLWITTTVYSAIFFFPSAYLNLRCVFGEECYVNCDPYNSCNWFLTGINENANVFIALTIWWTIGTFLPFGALLLSSPDRPVEEG